MPGTRVIIELQGTLYAVGPMRLVAHKARAPIGIRALASSSLYDVAPFPTVDAAQACVAAFRHAGFLMFPEPEEPPPQNRDVRPRLEEKPQKRRGRPKGRPKGPQVQHPDAPSPQQLQPMTSDAPQRASARPRPHGGLRPNAAPTAETIARLDHVLEQFTPGTP